MTTAAAVPATRDEELEGDEALQTLRRIGRRRLIWDSIARFRAADGFSHSRAPTTRPASRARPRSRPAAWPRSSPA